MIKISKGPAPIFMTDVKRKWCKEIQAAVNHYKNVNADAYKFKHYRDPIVKNELKKFFSKCAYCEAKYAGTSDGDVEHFRPKGRVLEKNPQSPGYYWLANNWDNLLLSCQHCNQGRIQQLIKIGLPVKEAKQGKVDQFPLRAGGKHVDAPGPIHLEEPYRLLINPCLDNPEDHFDYDDTQAVMIPKTDMGSTSIDVYALGRIELVKQRAESMKFFQGQLTMWHRAVLSYDKDPTPDMKYIMNGIWDLILQMIDLEAEFSGMNRFFLRKFLDFNGLKKTIPK